MKYKTFLVLLTGLVLAASNVFADVVGAADEAYRMAILYNAKGYLISPTNIDGIAGSGERFKVHIPVVKGLDYVILLGTDRACRDSKLYVYDEVGQLLVDDLRTDRRSGVVVRASYTGEMIAQIYISRTVGLCGYCVLVGRRGAGAIPSVTDNGGVKAQILPPAPEIKADAP